MDRRNLLLGAGGVLGAPFLRSRPLSALAEASPAAGTVRRCRPGDPDWPSAARWEALDRQVGGRLMRLRSPLAACRDVPDGPACRAVMQQLRNPYYLGDEPALTQTSGWADAWASAPSAYAVAAQTADDVVAAVTFARDNNLRMVVKGGGHSYQGTSSAPDSLLVWTRAMHDITLHDTLLHGYAGNRVKSSTCGK